MARVGNSAVCENKPKNCSWFKTPFLPNDCKMLAEEKSIGSACSEGPLRSLTGVNRKQRRKLSVTIPAFRPRSPCKPERGGGG